MFVCLFVRLLGYLFSSGFNPSCVFGCTRLRDPNSSNASIPPRRGNSYAESIFAVKSNLTYFGFVLQGLSLAIDAIDTGREYSASNLIDFVRERNIHSVISVFSLAGQIVGSSGGLLFLAEVLGTSVL